jgi:magnesium transporter
VNVGQRPKAEADADFELVICRMASRENAMDFDLEQVSIILGQGFVVSFPETARDVFDPVRERIRTGALVRSMGADYLAYALVDTMIDGYYPMSRRSGNGSKLSRKQ